MHAIIRLGNGQYYTSAVFGRYPDESSSDNRDLLIVFNQAKDRLIALPELEFTKDGFISRKVIIFDTHDSSWRYSYGKRHYGGVAYLSKKDCLSLIEKFDKGLKNTPIPEKCFTDDQAIKLERWNRIRTDYDIKNLLSIANSFHDGYVAECQRDRKTGNIRVLFQGTWGTDVELIFQGEASCHLHDPNEYEPWWYDCTLARHRSKLYLIDSSEANPEDFETWDTDCFCAKEIYYHVIPR